MARIVHLVTTFDVGFSLTPVCGSWDDDGAGWTTARQLVTCPRCKEHFPDTAELEREEQRAYRR